MDNTSLQHHGVLGQKWGVRRFQNKDGTLTAEGRRRVETKSHEDRQRKKEMRKDVKNRRLMSDAELKRNIERLKLEKQYRELTDEEINPGRKFVADVLTTSAKNTATKITTGAMLYGTKALMTQEFDVKELAAYMTPKPKNR